MKADKQSGKKAFIAIAVIAALAVFVIAYGQITGWVVYDNPITDPFEKVIITSSDGQINQVVTNDEALQYPLIAANVESSDSQINANVSDEHDTFSHIVADVSSSDNQVNKPDFFDDAKGFIEFTAKLTSSDGQINAESTDWYRLAVQLYECGNGITEEGEECDGEECCNIDCTFKTVDAVCRPQSGDCDVADYCTGDSAYCPADTFKPYSTPCDDGLFCSETDHCDGNNNCVQLTAKDCSDSFDCTIDSCDESSDSCSHIPDNTVCEDAGTCDDATGYIWTGICSATEGCTRELAPAENCTDGIDNDCDGYTDTADSDCPTCTDADRDGYCVEVDCDDNKADDPAGCPASTTLCNATTGACAICIHPNATEVLCDGIDQNCNAYETTKEYDEQLLVKPESKKIQKSSFYDWNIEDEKWVLSGTFTPDGIIIDNNEIALADFDEDGKDELLVKEKKFCCDSDVKKNKCTDAKSWFYEWDGDSWIQYDYSSNDGLPLSGNYEVSACDILGNDGIPELILNKEGFSKETKFYHWNSGTWTLVQTFPDAGLQLQSAETACGDYDKDGVNELIVKKDNERSFKAYTWSTNKWVKEAEYCQPNEPGDDLLIGQSEIAFGNVRGIYTIIVNPDDNPDTDGDGVHDCQDLCPNTIGSIYLGCPAAIETSANIYDCYWNNIRGKEAREGQEVYLADKTCVDALLALQFPATPSWNSLTSQAFTHKEVQLNAIVESDCIVDVEFADETGTAVFGVENGTYIVFGPFETTQWIPQQQKNCYNQCKKGKCNKDTHKYCKNYCHISWKFNPEEFAYAVYKPVITVNNDYQTSHLDFLKTWWNKLTPAIMAGTIVGSELTVAPSEYVLEVPEGYKIPPEDSGMTAAGEIDYIYPILMTADTEWNVGLEVDAPQGMAVSTDTEKTIGNSVDIMVIGLKETGNAITGNFIAEDTGSLTTVSLKAQHEGMSELDAEEQALTFSAPKVTVEDQEKTTTEEPSYEEVFVPSATQPAIANKAGPLLNQKTAPAPQPAVQQTAPITQPKTTAPASQPAPVTQPVQTTKIPAEIILFAVIGLVLAAIIALVLRKKN